jgi:hypothetical protein
VWLGCRKRTSASEVEGWRTCVDGFGRPAVESQVVLVALQAGLADPDRTLGDALVDAGLDF